MDSSAQEGDKLESLQSDDSKEDNSYIYAIAPKPNSEAEQIGINTTPAFECLDQLLAEGKITGSKAAMLKSKYQDLVLQLKNTRKVESRYLHEAKELAQMIQKQQADIEQGELFPTGTENGVTRLRADLMNHSNELSACNERIYQFDFKLERLNEEKHLLEKEFKRLPKKEEIDKKIKDYTQEIEELKVEIAQRLHDCKSLKEEHSSRTEQATIAANDLEKLEFNHQKLKDELVKIYAEPGHISKLCDLIARQQREDEDINIQFDHRVTDLNNEVNKLSDKKGSLLREKEEISKSLENQRRIFEEKEREVDLLIKECDLAKERQAELLGDRTSLDLNIKHAYSEKKSEHDIHTRKIREKDRDLKKLKKAELHLKVVKDTLGHTQTIYEKFKSQMDAQPNDAGTLLKKRKELQKEVDTAKVAFSQQNALTVREKQLVELSCQEEQRLLCDQGQLRVDVVDLTRLAQIKADEREQKARDFLKAELRYHKAIEDLKTKELAVHDNTKKFSEVHRRLEDFARLYEIIKNERNKCVNLIQMSTQKAAEMQEKIKILQNEVEILRTAATAKDRQLQKSKLKHTNAIVVRDSLCNEVNKQIISTEEHKDQIEQQKLVIAKLNDMINKAEENMVELRRRYEKSVQERNHRGLQLIERNEEVCVLYEKINVKDSIIRNGDLELQNRNEEIRFLKMELSDLKRQIDFLESSIPNKRVLDNELATLQIQLAQCHEYVKDMEKSLENPGNSERIRFLSGKDLPPNELRAKIEELELRLAQREEQLLEKELVYEQVNRLVGRVKNKSLSGKDDTLVLAKKVNEAQGKIKETTRKMMAMVSELSMNQANAMKLNQEIKAKENHLEQCYARMERGQPPSDEIEQEWLRCLRDEMNKIKTIQERRKVEVEFEHYKIPGGITTTAEPRPNAYIPNEGNELPLPRPYGASAPFKPTELGSNMRHIRKPVIKPIEI